MTATTTPRARLLAAVANNDGATQAALAIAAGMGRSTATTHLGKLVEDGLVVRRDNGKAAATYSVADLEAPRWVSTEAPAEQAAPAAEAISDEEAERIMRGEDGVAEELVDAVKKHAEEHYNAGGWDVIVECWDSAQIAERIAEAGAITPAEAVEAFRPLVDVWADREADAAVNGETEQGQAAEHLAATAEAAQHEQAAALELMSDSELHEHHAAAEGEAEALAAAEIARRMGITVEELAEEMSHTGGRRPAAPAAPTFEERIAGLARTTFKKAGAVLGDTVEVYLHGGRDGGERATGELVTGSGVAYLQLADGSQRAIGGWAGKYYLRVVAKRQETEMPGPRTRAKAAQVAAKAAAAPAEKVDRRKGDRSHYVPRGGLKAMVWAWYAANPGVEMTPHKLAKAISAKAPGAVLDQQRQAVKHGYAVECEGSPLRFAWLEGVELPEEQAEMCKSLGFTPAPHNG